MNKDGGCPHSGVHRYCEVCKVDPCPVGLGKAIDQLVKKAAAPVKAYGDCRKNGYEIGELCDDTADCARNGCAKACSTHPVAAPAPDADGYGKLVPARIQAYLTGGGLFNPELANHDAVRDLIIDARALIGQQARELASVTADRDETTETMFKALADLGAARAAIAAADADAARYRFLRMNPTQLGWDADYRPDEVDAAIDAARAAMGEK